MLVEAPVPNLTWPGAPAAPRAARSGFRDLGASAPHSCSTGTSSTDRARARNAPPELCEWPCERPPPAGESVTRKRPRGNPWENRQIPPVWVLTEPPASLPPGRRWSTPAYRPHLGSEPIQSHLQLPLVLAAVDVAATTEEGLAAQGAAMRRRHSPKGR